MISIGKLTNPDSVVEYLQHAITDSTTDYYSLRGESPGKWDGTGATILNLQGQVTPDQLRLLLNGLHPTTGEPLAHKWYSQRIVAFDVTFSAPKSVSLLYAIGNDEVRKAVLEAHDEAVDAVVQYLQTHAAFARSYNRRTQTVEPVAAHLVMPRFVHRTSRPVTDPRTGNTTIDPQLHTHIPIPTWVCRPDGSWSALLSEPLYQHAAAAGAVGQAVMRKHLVETLGVEVEVLPNGTFEVKGINEAMRREFSKRRQQIEVAEAMFGELDIAGREKANLATRERKSEVAVGPGLVLEWKERAHKVGLTQKLVTHLLNRQEPKQTLELTEESIAALVGEHGLTQENATFSRRDVVRKITTLAPNGLSLQQLEWTADQVLSSSGVMRLTPAVVNQHQQPEHDREHDQHHNENPLVPTSIERESRIGVGANLWAHRTTADPPQDPSENPHMPDLTRLPANDVAFGHESIEVNSPLPMHPIQSHARPKIEIRGVPSLHSSVSQQSSQQVQEPREPALAEQTVQLRTTGVERGAGENRSGLSHAASPERGAEKTGKLSPDVLGRDESARVLLTEPRYSTPEMVATERRMLDISLARKRSGVVQLPAETVEATIAAKPTLTAEQQNMVRTICTSGDGVIVVEGVAGSGKTFALNALRELYQESGHTVIGMALAGRAAQNLQEDASIHSSTLARALPYLEQERLTPRTVVIVDEAGMVGSRQLAKLVELTGRDGAKLVVCGDSHQLQPIDAGATFRALGEALGKIELRESIRHKEEWEKEALLALREGSVDAAVDAYIEKERVVVAENVMERRRMVVMEAIAASRAGENVVILTQTRNEAGAINELSRHLLKLDGELAGPAVEVDGKEFAVGDRAICTRGDSQLGVVNGLRGEVVAVDASRHRVSLRTKSGDIAIDTERYRNLDHAYALTAHKAQGVTVDVALVVGSESASREWAYSVMSRARKEARYFTVATPLLPEIEALNQVKQDIAVAQRLAGAWSLAEAKESTLNYRLGP